MRLFDQVRRNRPSLLEGDTGRQRVRAVST
jgi:hypothetical protein